MGLDLAVNSDPSNVTLAAFYDSQGHAHAFVAVKIWNVGDVPVEGPVGVVLGAKPDAPSIYSETPHDWIGVPAGATIPVGGSYTTLWWDTSLPSYDTNWTIYVLIDPNELLPDQDRSNNGHNYTGIYYAKKEGLERHPILLPRRRLFE